MRDVNDLAVAVAAVAALVASFTYYVAFGTQLERWGSAAAESPRPPSWLMPVELVRSLVVAVVVAGLAAAVGIKTGTGAVLLALSLWVGFPMIPLTGSVLHEKVQPGLAAIHGGDWLVKLLTITVIVSLWR
ncbi:MAG TPA: DUF1761 domain-containing protein [Nitriliruptorales bacterium]|nr:DUF1761 domain-containing protein [Nitriliruptorales bacterium]